MLLPELSAEVLAKLAEGRSINRVGCAMRCRPANCSHTSSLITMSALSLRERRPADCGTARQYPLTPCRGGTDDNECGIEVDFPKNTG
jgi:hypothetical protein